MPTASTPVWLTKCRAYWLCQAVGWGGFWLTQFYSAKALGRYSAEVPVFMGVLAVAGLALTHLYRALLLRSGVLAGPIGRQAAVGVVGLLTVNGLLYGVIAVWGGVVSGDWASALDPGRLWLGLTNGLRYLAVWFLAYHFFVAGRQLARVQVGQLRTEAALRQAELDTLRAQVNPHFLFNTLNSIRALTLSDPHAARTAVTQLADLLRYALRYTQQPLVALREELAAVQDYLALEQTRFGPERLRARLDVPPAVLGWPVPPATVLTLIENAVKHGISAHPLGGELLVRATQPTPTALLIEISQPDRLVGPGAAAAPHALAPPSGSGLGLVNTRQRLAALYGPAASCTLTESPPGTVVAALRVPAETFS